MAYTEVTNKTVKFNQVGDFVAGTLIEVIAGTKPDKYGKISNIYRILSDEGSFLGSTKNEKTGKSVLDKEETKISKDEEWTLFANGVLAGQLKRVKIGGKFMVKLTELKPSDKGNDIKIKKVYIDTDKDNNPVMNVEWLESQKSSMQEVEVGDTSGIDF
jgi:hypothetical protein